MRANIDKVKRQTMKSIFKSMSRNRLTPSVRERMSLSVKKPMPKTRSNPSVDRLRSPKIPKRLRGRS